MSNITLLPSAKVPLIYPDTNGMTTEWYRFFWNIYGFTGTGVVPVNKGGTGLDTIGNHQLIIGNTNNVFEPASLSSASIAITYPAGFVNLELGTSGVTPGTYGSASQVGVFTVNQYGVLTAASNTSIGIDASQIISGTLPVTRGGTGATTLTGYVKGNGTSAFTASATVPTTDLSGTLAVGNGGTGLTTLTAGYIPYGNGTGAFSSTSGFVFDGNNLGIGVTPNSLLTAQASLPFFNFAGTGLGEFGLNLIAGTASGGTSVAKFTYNSATGENRIGGLQSYVFPTIYAGGSERARFFTSGGVSIGNTTDPGAGNLSVTGTIRTQGYTVATLPTGVTGARAYVTNALAPTFGATVVGGGAVTIPVFYNGANWIVG